MNFDLTPGSEMYENFRKDLAASRKFFIQYQDRIFFGTDNTAGRGKPDPERVARSIRKVGWMREFLETKNSGIHLPSKVLEKNYAANFCRLVSARPKPLNMQRALAECERVLAEGKADFRRQDQIGELEQIVERIKGIADSVAPAR